MSQMRPQQNPEEMFSAEAAPKAKRADGLNGTVPELRRGSIRETASHEAELRAELAGRKVSHLQMTTTESDRTVFSVQEQNGGLRGAALVYPRRTEKLEILIYFFFFAKYTTSFAEPFGECLRHRVETSRKGEEPESPPMKSERETISTQSKEQHNSNQPTNPGPQQPLPRPLLITQTSATG